MNKPTVLVIDDEEDLLEVIADEVESYGYETLRASNAAKALEFLNEVSLQERSIHTILSDINMPKMTGLQMLEKMNEMGVDIPLIFISGYADKEKAILAMKLGAVDMLDKPHQPKTLENAIHKAVSYGLALENLENEVDQLLAKSPSTDPTSLETRDSIKKLLKMKKLRAAYFKAS